MGKLRLPKFYRQRFLLLLLEMAGGKLSKTDFQKLIFLSKEESSFSYYDFVPYQFGCYSFQAQSDIELLEKKGWLESKPKSIKLIVSPGECLNKEEIDAIECFISKFKSIRGKKLITYVYEQYPYCATRSEIASDILNNESYEQIRKERKKLVSKAKVVFTIGYEGISFEAYINQLLVHDVKLLCDVRKNPLSRKFGFSKGMLSNLLPKLGIEYTHIPDLGIQSELRKDLNSVDDYQILFKKYRKTLPSHRESIELLEKLLNSHKRIALTCFEKEHTSCHRHCVTDYLESKKNLKVLHI